MGITRKPLSQFKSLVIVTVTPVAMTLLEAIDVWASENVEFTLDPRMLVKLAIASLASEIIRRSLKIK